MRRIDDDSLLQLAQPVNAFPPFVRHVVQRLKVLCPVMGKKRIAETLCRAGLQLSATTVSRFLKSQSTSPPEETTNPETDDTTPARVVTSRDPNAVWHVDLTVVPTGKGFWTSWFPHAFPQVWPFCYWVAVAIDHFSRKVVGFAVFRWPPTSLEVRSFLGRTMSRSKARPRHLICDRGKQFDCEAFRKWCKRKKIKPRYGAVGKYGSIAIIERFMRSLKTECTRRIFVPLDLTAFRAELRSYATWYNEFRPHQALYGRTPCDVYHGHGPPALPVLSKVEGSKVERPVLSNGEGPSTPELPNSKLPELTLHILPFDGRHHLPIVELHRAA